MSAFVVEPFEPQPEIRGQWTALHAFRRARAEEDDPGEPIEPDDEFEHAVLRHWPLYENRRWIVQAGDEIIGVIGLGFRREDTLDYEQFAPMCRSGAASGGSSGDRAPLARQGSCQGRQGTMLQLIHERHPAARLMITGNA